MGYVLIKGYLVGTSKSPMNHWVEVIMGLFHAGIIDVCRMPLHQSEKIPFSWPFVGEK